MPNTRSAIRQLRKSLKRRERNKMHKSRMRTFIKYAREALSSGDVERAIEAVRMACRVIDKTASKGIIKPNTAARYKSRLTNRLNKLITSASQAT
ncbi:MAG: 30S ribosomal protein S20 [Armatimonadota bacterium]|nr:30S ribosomal protein S20 [Armatimonadota bacterium]MCX7776725.1 30S ribosomal protein S20 [Armatimonadota bacterium]MDW8025794.1 30S ribosomal protein S20 [Armatimonadota bacterium]